MAERWETVDSRVVADFGVFSVRKTRARSPRTGELHEFHMLDLPCCVKVIAFTEDDRVILVEQFRHAVERVTVEFPAGVMEDGEDPVHAALRELEEETGYRAATAERLSELDPDPAIHANSIEVVVARGCTADGARHQDAGEDVTVHVVAVEEVGALIRQGIIRHAAAISAWYLYEQRARPSAAVR
jgi:ADP-ribose pyrophosphatase